jgi:hypothetical protein
MNSIAPAPLVQTRALASGDSVFCRPNGQRQPRAEQSGARRLHAVLGALFDVGYLHVMTKSPEMMKPQNRSLLSCEETLLGINDYFFSELFGTFAEVIAWVKLTPFNTV